MEKHDIFFILCIVFVVSVYGYCIFQVINSAEENAFETQAYIHLDDDHTVVIDLERYKRDGQMITLWSRNGNTYTTHEQNVVLVERQKKADD